MRSDSLPAARPDPLRNAFPGQALVYGAIQTASSAWIRYRYRNLFDRVQAFALFIGYPRSGHSIVGAMVNANRHAVISHEMGASQLILAGCDRDVLYSRILARAAWFNMRGNRSNYEYQIPNQWQGRFESIRIVGDKYAGWATLALQDHPDFLQRIRDTVHVPLRLIHIVRNPFDNIAAISVWHRLSLDDSIAYYFSFCRTTGHLPAVTGGAELITLHHEDVIRSPASSLSTLCAFLGLETDAGYLADCSSVTFARPSNSRRLVEWSAAQVRDVERFKKPYSFLDRYAFDLTNESTD